MHISEIYKSIYKYYGDTTPLKVDCGQLCGGACCESDENKVTGMYLFPGEEKLFLDKSGFKIVNSLFLYDGEYAKILICKGTCLRSMRPLSCRIFPVLPYIENNAVTLIFDPRAKAVCPLLSLPDISSLDSEFVKKTKNVTKLLLKFKKTRAFLEGLSDIADDFLRF